MVLELFLDSPTPLGASLFSYFVCITPRRVWVAGIPRPRPARSQSRCFAKNIHLDPKSVPPLRSEHDFLQLASWLDRTRALELLIEHDEESNNRDFQPSCLHTRSALHPLFFSSDRRVRSFLVRSGWRLAGPDRTVLRP